MAHVDRRPVDREGPLDHVDGPHHAGAEAAGGASRISSGGLTSARMAVAVAPSEAVSRFVMALMIRDVARGGPPCQPGGRGKPAAWSSAIARLPARVTPGGDVRRRRLFGRRQRALRRASGPGAREPRLGGRGEKAGSGLADGGGGVVSASAGSPRQKCSPARRGRASPRRSGRRSRPRCPRGRRDRTQRVEGADAGDRLAVLSQAADVEGQHLGRLHAQRVEVVGGLWHRKSGTRRRSSRPRRGSA